MGTGVLLILAGLTCTVLSQDPSVTIIETEPQRLYGREIQVERDRDVTMSCFVENKQEGTMVRWNKVWWDFQKNSEQVFKISEDTSIEDNTKYSIEKPTQFQWRLRLKNAQIADEGNYTCFVYTTVDNRKEANVTVNVRVSPYFDAERTSSDTVAKAGDTIDLTCNATGRPRPNIMWSRIGNALLPIGKEIHYDPKLTITSIRAEDRGKYRCQAFNEIGTKTMLIQRDINVDVRFRPIVTPIHREVYQAPGYLIELQCLVEANPYPLEEGGLMWVFGARVISQSIGRYQVQALEGAFNRMTYELIIKDVRADDYGTYKCQIKNSEGMSHQNIELRRSDTPQPSMKLNRVIKGGASAVSVAMATLITCLIAGLLQQL